MSALSNTCRATLLVVMAAVPAAAQQPAAGATDSLRERLAADYLRLELALQDAAEAGVAVPAEERRRLSRAFDGLTLQFFSGNLQGALSSLDALVGSVAGGTAAMATLEERAQHTLGWLAGQRLVEDAAGAATPYLLHVPERTAPQGGWPVVVAVHGAGGDERMFFGGYGAGIIRELADAHGIAVVTPRAPLPTDALVALVDALAARHPLDASRVALVGHSMGAAIVGRAALERPERFRGVACIAGSCGSGGAVSAGPPVLMVAGALDPLFRVEMLAAQAESLRQAGRNVEFRALEDEGHTLVVGAALPAAMQWLAERLGSPARRATAR
jgi:predicted esterase